MKVVVKPLVNFNSRWTKAWQIIKAAYVWGWLLPLVFILYTFSPFLLLPADLEEQDQRHTCPAINLHPVGFSLRGMVKHTHSQIHKCKQEVLWVHYWQEVVIVCDCFSLLLTCLQIILCFCLRFLDSGFWLVNVLHVSNRKQQRSITSVENTVATFSSCCISFYSSHLMFRLIFTFFFFSVFM